MQKQVTYFIFTFVRVNELLNFKVGTVYETPLDSNKINRIPKNSVHLGNINKRGLLKWEQTFKNNALTRIQNYVQSLIQ